MTEKHGASADADRACALRAEPAAQSQAEPLVPSAVWAKPAPGCRSCETAACDQCEQLIALQRLPDMREFCDRLYSEADERALDALIGEAACYLETYARAIPALLRAASGMSASGQDPKGLEAKGEHNG